jgi:hypothetical protein
MAQHPPDDPQAEQLATKDETISAWLALSPEDKIRLDVYAEQQARIRQRCAPGITGSDLLQGAWTAVLEGRRKWPLRRISFLSFLLGVVMSISGDLPRTKAGRLAAATVSEHSLLPETDGVTSSRPLEDLVATTDSPEAIAIAKEQFAAFQRSFEDDEPAWYVLECVSEDLSGPEIQKKLGMSAADFNAATKRIARRVRKFFVSN